MAVQAAKCGLNVSAVCRDALVQAIENAGGETRPMPPRISRGINHGPSAPVKISAAKRGRPSLNGKNTRARTRSRGPVQTNA